MFSFLERSRELLHPVWADENNHNAEREKALQLIRDFGETGTVVRFIKILKDGECIGHTLVAEDSNWVELINLTVSSAEDFKGGIPVLAVFLNKPHIQKWVREEDARMYTVGFTRAEITYIRKPGRARTAAGEEEFLFEPAESMGLDLSKDSALATLLRKGANIAGCEIDGVHYYMPVVTPGSGTENRWIGGGFLAYQAVPVEHFKRFMAHLLNAIPKEDSLVMIAKNDSDRILPLLELGFVPEGYTFNYSAGK